MAVSAAISSRLSVMPSAANRPQARCAANAHRSARVRAEQVQPARFASMNGNSSTQSARALLREVIPPQQYASTRRPRCSASAA
ncbi:hypothetical protein [Actinoplanes sp. NPDC026619]|uniref:hypothetical protein n=1 Tax=Actinoplanes sp. NPDC026619 TaxID=3155798 RepID=UPI0033FE677A